MKQKYTMQRTRPNKYYTIKLLGPQNCKALAQKPDGVFFLISR